MTTIANFTVEGPVGSGTAGGNPVLTGALDGSGNTVASKVGKATSVLSTTPLTGNAVFTGAWVDTNLDGTVFVSAMAFADQASAANGFAIQETDDTGNANLIRSVGTVSVTTSTLSTLTGALRARYWRIQYTNGSSAQGSFELTVTASNTSASLTNTAGNLQVAQSGTWTVQPGNTPNTTPWLVTQSPTTSGGATLQKVLSAASTNATSVKASAGQVYSYAFSNSNAAFRYVHFYNKASAPTVGTDVPVFTVGLPPNFAVQADFNSGTPFVTGIAYSITTGASDSDSAAVGANDVTGFVLYK